MFPLLRLVMAVALLASVGCAAIPSAFTDRLDQVVKDNGAGQYEVACQVKKDQRQLVGVTGSLECTADMLQLTGCHKKGITFEGPK